MSIVLKRQVKLEEDIVTFRLVSRELCGSTEFRPTQQAIKLIHQPMRPDCRP